MRWLGSIRDGTPTVQGRVTTWWHGKMPVASVTWDQRNVASVTDTSKGNLTLTFSAAYQATPCVALGGGIGATSVTAVQAHLVSVTTGSVAFVTQNTSGTVVEGDKVSALVVGDL